MSLLLVHNSLVLELKNVYLQCKRSSREVETFTEDLATDDKIIEESEPSSDDSNQCCSKTPMVGAPEAGGTKVAVEKENTMENKDQKEETEVIYRRKSRASTSGSQEVLLGDDLEPFAGRFLICYAAFLVQICFYGL